ncbi:MAG: MATE family efflux transporter [Mangrovibacterium sp.]
MNHFFSTHKSILKLAIPVMLSQLGHVTVQLADNMMVGRLGTTELAAASFANSIFVLGMLLGTGICMGLTPLVGKFFLQKKNKELLVYLKNGLSLYSAIGIFIATILFAISFMLNKMGQTPEVSQLAQSYLWVLILSIPPLQIFASFKQFLEGLGNTRVAMIITIGANVINIAFNYLLIYGKCGFPELGLLGAGIATTLSRYAMAIAIYCYFRMHKNFCIMLKEMKLISLKFSKMITLLKIGVPIGFQIVFEVLIFSLAGIMMGWIGVKELAAHQITISIITASYMASLGIGAATTIKISHAIGANDFNQVKKLISASTHLTVGLMGSMSILYILLRYELPTLFSSDIDAINISASLFIVAAMFQIFDSLQVALLSVLRGMTDVNIPMLMACGAYFLIGTPACYLFAFTLNQGALGIWYGLLVSLIAAAALFAIRVKILINRYENTLH